MKDYSKYYTPESIAEKLLGYIDIREKKRVVDICCGTGNLLKVFKKKSNTAKCYGVDIIKKEVDDVCFFHGDGREYALNHSESFDYAIANPPFGKSSNKSFSSLLFSEEYRHFSSTRIEIEMLVANLILLKRSGYLLIILPSTFFKGSKYKRMRSYLAKESHIDYVFDLPVNTFAPEQIRTCAMILKKGSNSKIGTKVLSIDSENRTFMEKTISNKCMLKGDWYGPEEELVCPFRLIEGKVSSRDFCDDGDAVVLHTSRRNEDWEPSVHKAHKETISNCCIVSKGDIIISRIGASAGEKCVYDGEDAYYSDCLFVIKKPKNEIKERIMCCDFSQLVCGLSTPYIRAKDIYCLYLKQ